MHEAAEALREEGWKIHGEREEAGLVLASIFGAAAVFRWDGMELVKMDHEEALAWARRHV